MNNHRTYYGEYSLAYWIELILRREIVLPPYQRSFVWELDDFKTLLKSFQDGQFVPPVTIGAFKKNNGHQNLIIDGQQRLTTILLAYLALFPNKVAGKPIADSLSNENDDDFDDEGDTMFEWDFNVLLDKGNKKSDITQKCNSPYYETLDELPAEFFTETYLGFSYIIPNSDNEREIQKFFSTLFRNINMQGKTLYVLESRAALYYLNSEFKDWFDPAFASEISSSVVDKSVKSKMDFVRYLSLLAQYYNDGKSTKKIGYRYAKRMEEFYSEYINAVSYNEESSLFGKFSNLYPDNNYKDKLTLLENNIDMLGFKKVYVSIIDMDIHFMGLIYYTLFENKTLTTEEDKLGKLKDAISNSIKKVKRESNHVKTPSCLKYIRIRIEESIKVFKPYFS